MQQLYLYCRGIEMQSRRANRISLLWALPLTLGFALAAPNLSPVVDAAKGDNLATVRKLIADRAEVNVRLVADGSSALLWAAYHSNVDMTKALVAAGAEVDAANRYGVTPLLQASRNGDAEVLRVLRDAGANATRWHAEGVTPLMAAARTGQVDAVQLLLAHWWLASSTPSIHFKKRPR